MATEIERALVWAHRANLMRYRKLLEMDLTANERHFVETSLAEEEAALERLCDEERAENVA